MFFFDNESGFLLAIDSVVEVSAFLGWFHMGFCLATEAEVCKVDKQSLELNIEFARGMMAQKNEFASIYIFDLDGYKIEVSWHND